MDPFHEGDDPMQAHSPIELDEETNQPSATPTSASASAPASNSSSKEVIELDDDDDDDDDEQQSNEGGDENEPTAVDEEEEEEEVPGGEEEEQEEADEPESGDEPDEEEVEPSPTSTADIDHAQAAEAEAEADEEEGEAAADGSTSESESESAPTTTTSKSTTTTPATTTVVNIEEETPSSSPSAASIPHSHQPPIVTEPTEPTTTTATTTAGAMEVEPTPTTSIDELDADVAMQEEEEEKKVEIPTSTSRSPPLTSTTTTANATTASSTSTAPASTTSEIRRSFSDYNTPITLAPVPPFPTLPILSSATAATTTGTLTPGDRMNIEQVFIQAESQYAELKAINIKLQQAAARTTGDFTLLQEKFEAVQTELAQKKQEVLRQNLLLTERQNEIVQLKSDSNRLLQSQHEHAEELAQLRQSNQSYIDKVLALNLDVSRLSHQVNQLEKQNLPFNFRIEQLESEKRLLQQHQSYLDETLKQKTEELYQVKTSMTNRQIELEGELEKVRSQFQAADSQNQELKQQIKELNISIQTHLNTERDQSISHAASLTRLEQEISTQTRLSHLYQQSRDEFKEEVATLQQTRQQLQQNLTNALAHQQEFEQSTQATIDRLKEDLARRDQTIDELTRTNTDLTQQLQLVREEMNVALTQQESRDGGVTGFSLVPNLTFDSTNRGSLVNGGGSGGGVSLTHTQTTTTHSTNVHIGHAELYSKYLQALDQLRQEKHESKLIEQYLQQIQREISEKAPLIEQQRFAYNKLLTLNTNLADQLQQLQAEHTKMKNEYEKLGQIRSHDQDDLNRLKQESDDLARQVRSLLRGKLHGGSPHMDDVGRLGAQELISTTLVEVTDIDDLQAQNQRLLTVVRDLSKQNEEFQASAQQSLIQQQKEAEVKQSAQLTEAYQIIDTLKEQRKGLEIRLEALLHGVALNANTNQDDSRMMVLDPQSVATARGGGWMSSANSATAGLISDLQQQIRDLTATYDQAKSDWSRERSELQTSLTDAQAQHELIKKEQIISIQQVTQQYESTRTQFTDARMQIAKIESELKSYQALYTELKTRHAESLRETDALRTRLDTLHAQTMDHQKQYQASESQRRQAEEAKQTLTKENLTLQANLTLANKSIQRYTQENAELTTQLTHLQSLIQNLQTMQTVFDSRESSARETLIKEKETLRIDWVTCKKELDEERHMTREMDKHHQNQLEDIRHKLEAAQQEYQQTKEQLIQANTHLQHHQQRVTQLESELATAKDTLDSIYASRQREKEERDSKLADSSSQMSKEQQLEIRVQTLQDENRDLLTTIAEQKTHITNLTQISTQTEKELQSLTLDSRLYQLKSEKELDDLRQTKSNLTGRIEKLGQDLKKNELENAQQIDELHQTIQRLEGELQQANISKQNSEKISNEYITNLERLQGEIRLHTDSATQNQLKYEKELTHHANTIKELTTRRQESERLQQELNSIRGELVTAQLQLQTANQSNQQSQLELQQMTQSYETKLVESKKQTELLYGQLEVLNIQIKRIQENQQLESLIQQHETGDAASSSTTSPMDVDGSSLKTLSDLRDIIKYLRREKDELTIEHERLTQQHARSESEVQQLKAEIQEVKDQMQTEIRRTSIGQLNSPMKTSGGTSGVVTASDHARLLSDLNQLQILQESNSMLRDENQKSLTKIQELQTQLNRSETSVQPLKQRINELEAIQANLESDLSALRLENSRWSGRYQKLLTQSDFIDPEIYKQLKEEHDALQQQKVTVEQELATIKTTLEQVETDRTNLTTRFDKMRKAATHWKEQFEKANKDLEAVKQELQTLQQQSAANQDKQAQLEELSQSKQAAELRLVRTTTGLSHSRRLIQLQANQVAALKSGQQDIGGGQLQAKEKEIEQLKQSFKEKEEKLKKEMDLRVSLLKSASDTKLATTRTQLETDLANLRTQLDERTKELQHAKQAVQTIKAKLATQRAQLTSPTPPPPEVTIPPQPQTTVQTIIPTQPVTTQMEITPTVAAPTISSPPPTAIAPATGGVSLKRKLSSTTAEGDQDAAAKRPATSPHPTTTKPLLKRPPPTTPTQATIEEAPTTTNDTVMTEPTTIDVPPPPPTSPAIVVTQPTSALNPRAPQFIPTTAMTAIAAPATDVEMSPPGGVPAPMAPLTPTGATRSSTSGVAFGGLQSSPFGTFGGASQFGGFGTTTTTPAFAFGSSTTGAPATPSTMTNYFGSATTPTTSAFGQPNTSLTAPAFGSSTSVFGSGTSTSNMWNATSASASAFGGAVFGSFTAAAFGQPQTINTFTTPTSQTETQPTTAIEPTTESTTIEPIVTEPTTISTIPEEEGETGAGVEGEEEAEAEEKQETSATNEIDTTTSGVVDEDETTTGMDETEPSTTTAPPDEPTNEQTTTIEPNTNEEEGEQQQQQVDEEEEEAGGMGEEEEVGEEEEQPEEE